MSWPHRIVVLAALVLGGVRCDAQTAAGEEEKDVVVANRGFKISRPDFSWTFRKTETKAGKLTLTLISSKEKAVLSVTAEFLPPEVDNLTKHRDKVLHRTKGKSQYRNGTAFDVMIAGRKSPSLLIDQQIRKQTLRLQQSFVKNQGILYTIDFYATRPRFAKLFPRLQAIRDTFQFVPINLADRKANRRHALANRCGSEVKWARSWSEAERRARDGKKLVLLFISMHTDFSAVQRGPLMDEDVVRLINANCIPLRYHPKMVFSPVQSYKYYGIGPLSFGSTALLMKPDGTVVGDLLSPRTFLFREFLLQHLSARPARSNQATKSKQNGLASARESLRCGRLSLAASQLGDLQSRQSLELRATLQRLQRNGVAAIATIARAKGMSGPDASLDLAVEESLVRIRMGQFEAAQRLLKDILSDDVIHRRRAEAMFWQGICVAHLSGCKHATVVWDELMEKYPEQRWSWHAAALMRSKSFRDGKPPRVRWPAADVLSFLRIPASSPLAPERVAEAKRSAIRFLVTRQRADGSWRSTPAEMRASAYRTDSLTAAVTAIGCRALFSIRSQKDIAPIFDKSREFVTRWALQETGKPHSYLLDYSPWGYAYALRLFSRCKEQKRVDQEQLGKAAANMVAALQQTQMKGGGWNYRVATMQGAKHRSTNQSASFMTATVVISLMEAQRAGFEIPSSMIQAALSCLLEMRNKNHSFEYFLSHQQKSRRSASEAGAAGRGPLCSLALFRGGKLPLADVRRSIEIFLKHDQSYAREQGKSLMHAAPHGQGSHYLLFDYAWCAEAIKALPVAERAKYQQRFLKHVLNARLSGGSFLDNAINGKHYGAGMALQALHLLSTDGP